MRILALRTGGRVLPSIHDSTVRALRSLGADVIDLRVPRHERGVLSLSRRARDGFDAVFTLDMGREPYFTPCLKELQSTMKLPWLIWFVDDPEGYGFPSACDPAWTLAFCWDQRIARELSVPLAGTAARIFHLPLAADPEIFFPEKKSSAPLRFPGGVFVGSTGVGNDFLEEAGRTPGFMEEFDSLRERLRGDGENPPQSQAWSFLREKTGRQGETLRAEPVSRLWVHTAMYFLGIRKRREVVSLLIGPRGAVFGDAGWKSYAEIPYRGEVEYGAALRTVYGRSAFVLDVRQPQARTGLTQRTFDAAACGRPVLAEYSPEMETIFGPEYDFFSFRSPEEALEMKSRVLRHPIEAAARARKARRRILSDHTYRERARQMLCQLAGS